jgi:hypothetical protein
VDIPSIRLRADQSRLAKVVDDLKAEYPTAKLAIRERRNRGPKEVELRPASRPSGNLRRYSQ